MKRLGSLALCLVMSLVTVAQASDEEAILRFADDLVAEKRFDAAALEYKRALAYAPSARTELVYRKMLDASLRAGDGLLSLERAHVLIAQNPAPDIRCVGKLYEARSLYKLENYPGARRGFIQMEEECGASFRDDAYYGAALTALWQKDWLAAGRAFSAVAPDSLYGSTAARGAANAQKGGSLPHRSPTIAALLSVPVPGLGYAYAGQPKTAIAALFTNALFIFGTVSAARKKETGVAALVGLFSAGWYFGGVYGSASSARRFNRTKHEDFVRSYELE